MSASVMGDLTKSQVERLYGWIDEIPLSRQKRTIARDFSDGVMAAEVMHYFYPKYVELHNYTPANATPQKLENWRTLNRKVLCRLDLNIPDEILQNVVRCKPGIIEYVLYHLMCRIETLQQQQSSMSSVSQIVGPYGGTIPAGYIPSETYLHNEQDAIRHHVASATGDMSSAPVFRLPPIVSKIPPEHPRKGPKPSRLPLPKFHMVSPASPGNGTYYTGPGPGQADGRPPQKEKKLPPIGNSYTMSKRNIDVSYQAKPTGMGGAKKTGMDMQIMLAEKDQVIMELQETVQLLQMKVNRLEHLVRIKDIKIEDTERRILARNKR